MAFDLTSSGLKDANNIAYHIRTAKKDQELMDSGIYEMNFANLTNTSDSQMFDNGEWHITPDQDSSHYY